MLIINGQQWNETISNATKGGIQQKITIGCAIDLKKIISSKCNGDSCLRMHLKKHFYNGFNNHEQRKKEVKEKRAKWAAGGVYQPVG